MVKSGERFCWGCFTKVNLQLELLIILMTGHMIACKWWIFANGNTYEHWTVGSCDGHQITEIIYMEQKYSTTKLDMSDRCWRTEWWWRVKSRWWLVRCWWIVLLRQQLCFTGRCRVVLSRHRCCLFSRTSPLYRALTLLLGFWLQFPSKLRPLHKSHFTETEHWQGSCR